MKNSSPIVHETHPDPHHDLYSKTVMGFWIYILTDFVLFAAFFACFAVLSKSTYGGPGAKELFTLPFGMAQTMILLSCAFTSGLGSVAAHRKDARSTVVFFTLTFLLGIAFAWLEFSDFSRLVHSGNGWQRSAFLSAYFTLVGTHAIHILFGLLWIIVLLIPVLREGITSDSIRRLTCLRMFWQFLNIVWVFIFTFIYFMGRGTV